jgi:hypothetical protein
MNKEPKSPFGSFFIAVGIISAKAEYIVLAGKTQRETGGF